MGFAAGAGSGPVRYAAFKSPWDQVSRRATSLGARSDSIRAVASAELKPIVDRVFAYDEAREAFSHLATKALLGKIVIRCVR